MKTLHTVVCIMVLWFLLAGCGGGSNTPDSGTVQSGGRGSATFTVTWPPRSRLVPLAANSIVVTIYQGTTRLQQKVLPRPSGGGTSSGMFTLLPTGSLSATATACPNADGTGIAQATATVPLIVQANLTTPVSITMNSTIDHLVPSAVSVTVYTGASAPISATAYDAANNVVITSAFNWNSTNTAIVTVDQSGNITGGAASGTPVTVTVTETESGKSTSVSVTVLQSASSNPFLYDGFAYPAGSAVNGLNGGTGNWGNAWNEYGQGETSSVISTTGLTFSNLVTTGNALMTTSDRPVGHARRFATSPGKVGPVLYISYLMKPLDAMNAGYPNTYFGLGYGGVLGTGKNGGDPYYGLSNYDGSDRFDSKVVAVTGQTVFIVIRITFGPANGNDVVDMFINPPPGQQPPVVPDCTKSDINTGTPLDFNLGGSIRCMFDEVRFGHNYIDVVPAQ